MTPSPGRDRRRPRRVPGDARRLLEADGWIVVGEAADGRSRSPASPSAATRTSSCSTSGCPTSTGSPWRAHVADDAGRRLPAIVLISSREAAAFGGRLAASAGRGFCRQGRPRRRAPPRPPDAAPAMTTPRPRPPRGPGRHRARWRSSSGPLATYQLTLTAPTQPGADARRRGGRLVDDRGRPGHRRPAAREPDRTARDPHRVRLVRRGPRIRRRRPSWPTRRMVVHGWFDPLFALVILAYPTGRHRAPPSSAGWRSASSSSRARGPSSRPMRCGRSPGGRARTASQRSMRGSTRRSRWSGSGASRPRR